MKRIGWLFEFCLVLASILAAGCSASGGDEQTASSSSALCTSVGEISNDSDNVGVPGQQVTWTASPSCTGTPQYRFNLRDPSGNWTLAQDWGASNVFNWNTTGLALGSWNIQVWIRDITSGSYQAYKGIYFTLVASSACTKVTTTPTTATVVRGGTVTFNSTPTTCTSTEYEVHHLPPGGAWEILRAYTASSSFDWVTNASTPTGSHILQVWARVPGSGAQYQAYSQSTVTVNASTACTAVTLSLSPVTHASVGTPVTLTANATGCTAPSYRYLYKNPAGTFIELQPYTTSNTAVWNTSLAPSGAYTLQVLARGQGSLASYEAAKTASYTLDPVAQSVALSVSGGYAHECLLLPSGKVGCWGYGAFGQLGNGANTERVATPVAVTGLTQGLSLASGYNHNCAVVFGGAVKCWGTNLHGQLGNGTKTDANTPVQVSGITSASAVGAGNAHSCAALSDGSVQCWGYNSQGQLGNGAVVDSTVPVTVSGLTNAIKVSAGYYHSCAVLNDGSVRCWGYNAGGQLGNGSTVRSLTPVTVSGLSGVVSIASDNDNNCAVKTNGTIWCWGGNTSTGTLGNGSTAPSSVPVQIPGVTSAVSVALSDSHGCAALSGGTVTCWGYNVYGQLGNNSTTDSLALVSVANISTAKTVGVATWDSCAALSDNSATCWGYGVLGTLGNGAYANSSVPVTTIAIP